MTTSSERYRAHVVWETLALKRESLNAARFDSAEAEQWRKDIIDWLDEALKTRFSRQPALYLSVLDDLSTALNQLPVDTTNFKQFIANRNHTQQGFQVLQRALRDLPPPPPRDLKASYVDLLDKEVEARTIRLDELEQQVRDTERALGERRTQLQQVSDAADALRADIESEREAIASVSRSAETMMREEWEAALADWRYERKVADADHDERALESIATLAATARAGEALAEHAAGDLSSADWSARANRERHAAKWIRAGAWVAFLFAGIVGFYIVNEAIIKNFDISIGGGILRASVAVVIASFGALLLREAGRHFRESDTAEDVALALRALAPFYANTENEIKLAARVQVGDAVLVKNVLSRFAHRDAAKHGIEVRTSELPDLVVKATEALGKTAERQG